MEAHPMNDDICAFPNCPSPAWTDGWCHHHGAKIISGKKLIRRDYGRLIWLIAAADGFEHPRDSHGCFIWPYARNKGGYGVIMRDFGNGPTGTNAGRWLCEMIHGPAPADGQTWVAAHGCGRGRQGCVTPEHLAWRTHIENEFDRMRHGKIRRGERNNKAKLTEADVRAILLDRRIAAEIAHDYGVSHTAVSNIKSGATWRHVYVAVVAEGLEVHVHKSGGVLGQPRSKKDREALAAADREAHKS